MRHCWLRALGFLAPGLALFAVAGLWQGRAAYELALDQHAWWVGEPVAVTSVDTDTAAALFSRHVRTTATYRSGTKEQHVVRDDYWTLLTDAAGEEPLEARRDPSTGRVSLSWSVHAAPWRWAWVLFFGLLLGGFGAFLWRVSWQALGTLRAARAAARDSVEVELEVIEVRRHNEHLGPGGVEVTYRVPPRVSRDGVSYREPAASSSSVHTEHFEQSDKGPVLLDGGARILALRPGSRSARMTVLSSGFWPFLLEDADRELALAQLHRRAERPGARPA